jgi:hypothetical protein
MVRGNRVLRGGVGRNYLAGEVLMDAKEFGKLLRHLRACDDAQVWADGKTLAEVWATCERGDWMLWLCGKMKGKAGWPTPQEIVLAVCDCAELALPIFEKKYPKDNRPRTAIETARKWANGEALLSEVKSAASAAYAAAHAASAAYAAASYAAYAADAADAAAHAAHAAYAAYAAASYAAYAADAADAAAHAASAAYAAASYASYAADAADAAAHAASAYAALSAARTKTLKQCADICRKRLHVPTEVPR